MATTEAERQKAFRERRDDRAKRRYAALVAIVDKLDGRPSELATELRAIAQAALND